MHHLIMGERENGILVVVSRDLGSSSPCSLAIYDFVFK
jgi:hypothetical protein